ncbi:MULTISPECIES: DUF2306 domain-containing protein [Sphingomonas]|jgi:uncharacterized membrane protein|uniref:DUF2306 domain-containing protein n=1 Tax=Sphingomonas hankookensis TaxID=563996 RepID=A0ABR5YB35_9SPHN|nr:MULTISPECIES: DUF2306 domain-containing protein [Sphingomonas]KZE13443.1 hypothetical protein AVT10_15610 [Sphingomonas hankookensis]PZT90965.1 MAG: DUF2306 domain-containing protein [Sphingomonas sp.]RSV30966.1 DUF2306 domain-containing protein [Sphingomonas sp. ABOLH]
MMPATAKTAARTNDLSPLLRGAMVAGGTMLGLLSLLALIRAATGIAPAAPAAHDVAVAVHLASVLPAIPLGLYILLTRKGGARHRLLGRVWMALMVSTALSALFIRQLNHGGFSWIHLFVPVTLVAAWAAIAAARAGDIAKHRRRLVAMFLGAMVVPGLFAFAPGRVMAIWAFG